MNRWNRQSAAHLFGTDELGRDILNMTVYGARISMSIGLMATLITIFVGALIGVISGFVGGRTDSALMRLTDFFLVLPTFVLAIILAPVILEVIGVETEILGLRATLLVIVVVIGITSWAVTARIIRSQTLSIRERMFVDRARVIGSGPGHIMRRHIFPNVVNLIVAQAVITFAAAVFIETSLSFIGLGDPFAPSWGQILDSAQSSGAPGLGAWWYFVPPAACVVLVVLVVHPGRERPGRHPQPEVGDPPMSDPRDLLHVADDLHADDLGPEGDVEEAREAERMAEAALAAERSAREARAR